MDLFYQLYKQYIYIYIIEVRRVNLICPMVLVYIPTTLDFFLVIFLGFIAENGDVQVLLHTPLSLKLFEELRIVPPAP